MYGKAWQLPSEIEHMWSVCSHWWHLSLWGSQFRWKYRHVTVQDDRDGNVGVTQEVQSRVHQDSGAES